MANEDKVRVKFPISAKLILIIGTIIILSLGVITLLVSYFVTSDVRIKAENNNFTINSRSANVAESNLTLIRSNVFMLLDLLSRVDDDEEEVRTMSLFFSRNAHIGAVILLSQNEGSYKYDSQLINTNFFIQADNVVSDIDDFMTAESEVVDKSFKGEVNVLNASPFFDSASIAFITPWNDTGLPQVAVVIASSEFLSESFGAASTSSSFIVNSFGDLLVHPDFELVKANANFSNYPLFQQMVTNNDNNRQVLFDDGDGVEYFGAYEKLSIGGLAVMTIVPSAIIYESVINTTKRNIYLTIAVLCIAVLFIWIYSKSISVPLGKLTAATEEIERGNYNVSIQAKSHDELAVLSHSFTQMSRGLAERERLKDSFGRFTNKELAEKAMKGELALGGESKVVTTFFSDIRSFTAISEKLTPDEVVEFLNAYMTRMVKCVNATHGVVDKFIGDAIMAVWGAPNTSGDPRKDALNCICAALMMRSALYEFNKGRGGDHKPIIKIGCGINTGPVIAGQVGSDDRMEYTVIGDSVNLASRTEALNKPFGTDILITENTYNLVRDYVVVEEMPSVHVKGKAAPIKMFAVVNVPSVRGIAGAGEKGPTSIAQVRRVLGIPTPDLANVNTDEEEKKYSFGDKKK